MHKILVRIVKILFNNTNGIFILSNFTADFGQIAIH